MGMPCLRSNEVDVYYWLDKYTIGQNTYVILSLLYPELKLSQVSFHQDHCHPYVSFDTKRMKDLGITEDKITEWQFKRNLLPNLRLTELGSQTRTEQK